MSRALLSAIIVQPLVRRRRKADGAVFGVVKLRDRDKFDDREWTAFVNDEPLIEQIEALRTGEPVCVAGAFSAAPLDGAAGVEWKIRVEGVFDLKRKPKGKRAIAREERITSDEADLAPKPHEDEGRPFNDALPW